MTLSWASWIIQRRSLLKLSMYLFFWKYRWFLCSSHSIREILLWWRASLQSALIIWAANMSLTLTCFHSVWVKVSAKSSLRFEMSWSSWDSTSSTLNFSTSRFMRAKINKETEKIEDRCNWTESKMMICDWSIMTLMSRALKTRFSTILKFKTWVFRIVWYWYWELNVFLFLERSFERRVKAFNLSLILSKQYVMQ